MINYPEIRSSAMKAVRQVFGTLISDGYGNFTETDVLRLYAISHTIYLCANIRAENMASIPLYEVDQNGDKVIDSDLNFFFSPEGNYSEVAKRVELSLFFVGQNLTVPMPDIFGKFTPFSENIRWVNPRLWEEDVDPRYGLIGFNLFPDFSTHLPCDYVDAKDGIYFHYVDLFNDFDGVSPAEVAYRAAVAQNEKWVTIQSYFDNHGVPDNILQPTQDAAQKFARSKDAPRKLSALLQRLYKGSSNSGKTLVSPDRLEILKLQDDLDKLANPQLSSDMENAILQASQVPKAMINLDENSEEAVNFWLRYWLKPRGEWLASQYSLFFTKWRGRPVRIKADFSKILTEDLGKKIDLVDRQLKNSTMDLYTAQLAQGHPAPDERLQGIYLVLGQPIYIDKIVEMARTGPVAQAASGMNSDPNGQAMGLQANGHPMLGQFNTVGTIPDNQWREIKAWMDVVKKRGLKSTFEVRTLPPEIERFIRWGLDTDLTGIFNLAIKSMKGQAPAIIMDYEGDGPIFTENTLELLNAIGFEGLKTEETYRKALRANVRGLWSGALDAGQFDEAMKSSIGRAYRQAWNSGYIAGGGNPDEMESEALGLRDDLILRQYTYIPEFSRAISESNKSSKGLLAPLLNRVENWVARYTSVQDMGKLAANLQSRFKWVYDPAKEHCDDCLSLNGRVYTSKTWLKLNITPRSAKLACFGIHCGCKLEPTEEPVTKGRLPMLSGRKSEKRFGLLAEGATV